MTTVWFRKAENPEDKMALLQQILERHGKADLLEKITNLRDPAPETMRPILLELGTLPQSALFQLIGERKPEEPLMGIEVAKTPYFRLILNRCAPMRECALHDHGGLDAQVLTLGKMMSQEYVLNSDQPERKLNARSMVDAGSFMSVGPQDIHSLRAVSNKCSPDTVTIAGYFRPGRELGELVPWRTWDPGSCKACKFTACRESMKLPGMEYKVPDRG